MSATCSQLTKCALLGSTTVNGKTFTVFQPIAKVFLLNHLLCTVHDGHGLMHCKSFPVNSVFCAKPRKFSHSKVLLYTVLALAFQVFI